MSASSNFDRYHSAERGRLHICKSGRFRGAWSSRRNVRGQWLQVRKLVQNGFVRGQQLDARITVVDKNEGNRRTYLQYHVFWPTRWIIKMSIYEALESFWWPNYLIDSGWWHHLLVFTLPLTGNTVYLKNLPSCPCGLLQSTQVTREQYFQEWNEHSNFPS